MSVFPSAYAERAFRDTHCRRCFQPDEAMKRVTGDGPGLRPAEKLLVPVDGWPDYAAQQRKSGADHQ
ncbi:hypothetical protein [Mycolicibacterium sp. F2034L]|uniref:hypothetical protein n=1 Tax=Mycolicibacterium sp. F2034L TaxID=2926422 RepID=UPI001FF6DAB4|nr:hypothetical protein [Mycolicibacterium sp. F2034L]MCK0174786.1 hypothetical protein [Mycolicibacterium sp. F2034L]